MNVYSPVQQMEIRFRWLSHSNLHNHFIIIFNRNHLVPIQALRPGLQGSTILAGQSLLWWWLSWFPHFQSCTTLSRTGQRTGAKVFIRPFAVVEIITCQTQKNKTNPNKPQQMGTAYEPSYLVTVSLKTQIWNKCPGPRALIRGNTVFSYLSDFSYCFSSFPSKRTLFFFFLSLLFEGVYV